MNILLKLLTIILTLRLTTQSYCIDCQGIGNQHMNIDPFRNQKAGIRQSVRNQIMKDLASSMQKQFAAGFSQFNAIPSYSNGDNINLQYCNPQNIYKQVGNQVFTLNPTIVNPTTNFALNHQAQYQNRNTINGVHIINNQETIKGLPIPTQNVNYISNHVQPPITLPLTVPPISNGVPVNSISGQTIPITTGSTIQTSQFTPQTQPPITLPLTVPPISNGVSVNSISGQTIPITTGSTIQTSQFTPQTQPPITLPLTVPPISNGVSVNSISGQTIPITTGSTIQTSQFTPQTQPPITLPLTVPPISNGVSVNSISGQTIPITTGSTIQTSQFTPQTQPPITLPLTVPPISQFKQITQTNNQSVSIPTTFDFNTIAQQQIPNNENSVFIFPLSNESNSSNLILPTNNSNITLPTTPIFSLSTSSIALSSQQTTPNVLYTLPAVSSTITHQGNDSNSTLISSAQLQSSNNNSIVQNLNNIVIQPSIGLFDKNINFSSTQTIPSQMKLVTNNKQSSTKFLSQSTSSFNNSKSSSINLLSSKDKSPVSESNIVFTGTVRGPTVGLDIKPLPLLQLQYPSSFKPANTTTLNSTKTK